MKSTAESLLQERRRVFQESRREKVAATNDFIVFSRQGKKFGFFATVCDQIRRLQLTSVSGIDPVVGLCILRGTVYAVVDYYGNSDINEREILAFMRHDGEITALVVDEVVELVSCNDDEWQATQSSGERLGTLQDGTPILNIEHLSAQWNSKGT